jgi:hypothetical protein
VVTAAAACERFQGLLAEDVLVGIDAPSRAELSAHLEICPKCRAEADGLARAADALAWVDPAVAAELARTDVPVADAEPTRALDLAVAEILARDPEDTGDGVESPQVRRRHRYLIPVLAVAAAVVLLAVVGAVNLSRPAAPVTRSVALSGSGGAHATAVLTAESWGTSVTLTEPATRQNQLLTVSMTGQYGSSWNAGSYWGSASHGVTVTLACALPINRIRTIAVTDPAGRSVLAGGQAAGYSGN